MGKILFTDKTRWQHFGWAVLIGATLTMLCVIGVAFALEFKDKRWGGTWDWKDLACTLLGGAVGQAVQIVLIYVSLCVI